MNGGKRKLSEEYEKKVIGLLETIADQTKPKEESSKAETSEVHGHATVAEQMLCENCNPPEEYKKAHLKLMGQKECKDCGHIDKEEAEECENCGEEYET